MYGYLIKKFQQFEYEFKSTWTPDAKSTDIEVPNMG